MPKTTIEPAAPLVAENEKPSGSPLVTGTLQEAGTSSGKRAASPKKPKKAPTREPPEGQESDEDEPPKAKRGKKASKPAEKATKLPMRSVLQFKITLRNVKPEVWRRIQVLNNITFSEFRRNVNEAMGWMSNRSHQFIVYNEKTNSNMFVRDGVAPSYAYDDMKDDDTKILKEENTKLCKFFNVKGESMMYEYDMAENWFHDIVLEKVFAPAAKKADYPRCVGGKMACPPEDCGGAEGYKHIIKVFNNKNHEEYEELIRGWLWDMYPGFNPEAFNKKKIFPKQKKPQKVWMWLPSRR